MIKGVVRKKEGKKGGRNKEKRRNIILSGKKTLPWRKKGEKEISKEGKNDKRREKEEEG